MSFFIFINIKSKLTGCFYFLYLLLKKLPNNIIIIRDLTISTFFFLLLLKPSWQYWREPVRVNHSNDSHQCPILAADLFWDRKWIAYLYPSLTSRPCLDGFFIFCPIIKNNKVSCQYGTLMWIITVIIQMNHYFKTLYSYLPKNYLVHIRIMSRYENIF